MTAGVSAYFTWVIATYGIVRALGYKEIGRGPGALVVFGAWIVSMIAALAVSDWLSKRYPKPLPAERDPQPQTDSVAERL